MIESRALTSVSGRPNGDQMILRRSATGQYLRSKARNDFTVQTAVVRGRRLLQAFVNLIWNALQTQVGWQGNLQLAQRCQYGTVLPPVRVDCLAPSWIDVIA